MSDPDQITLILERPFHEEGHRNVSYDDPNGEFQATLRFLDIDGVTRRELARLGTLGVKIRIERDEPAVNHPGTGPRSSGTAETRGEGFPLLERARPTG
jgi:hypothetical protein